MGEGLSAGPAKPLDEDIVCMKNIKGTDVNRDLEVARERKRE